MLHFVQPLAAVATLTKAWRWAGLLLLGPSAQAAKRLRAVSMESTVNRVSGEPCRLSAMWMRLP